MNSEISTGDNGIDSMKNKLVRDIKTVVSDGDALVRGAASSTTRELSEALGSIEGRFDNARAAVSQRAHGAVDATGAYVAGHPWRAIAVVAGLGLLIGALLGRR